MLGGKIYLLPGPGGIPSPPGGHAHPRTETEFRLRYAVEATVVYGSQPYLGWLGCAHGETILLLAYAERIHAFFAWHHSAPQRARARHNFHRDTLGWIAGARVQPLAEAFAYDAPLTLVKERSGINIGLVNLGATLMPPVCRGANRSSPPGVAIERIESVGAVERHNAAVRIGWSRHSILPGDRIVGIGRIHASNASRFHYAASLLTSNWPISGTALFHMERGYPGEFPDTNELITHFLRVEREWQEYVQLFLLGGELSRMMADVTRGDR